MDLEKEKKIQELMARVADSKGGKLDLSSDEDLSIAIMNLISIEEHFFFTGMETDKPEYFDLLYQAREMRKELLKKIIKEYEGEVWCISKHLLAASMRLMEVGAKELGKGNKKGAQDFFGKAYDLYSLFWGINLKLVDMGGVKKIGDNQMDKNDTILSFSEVLEGKKDSDGKGRGIFKRLGEIVKNSIDCCKE